MATQLDILSKVMTSLSEDRTVVMDNIMALLSNRDKEVNLVSKLKSEMSELHRINGVMQENEHFMIQIAQSMVQTKNTKESSEDLGIGSDGGSESQNPSEK